MSLSGTMFRPIVSCLRSAVTPTSAFSHILRHCSHVSSITSRPNPSASLPPPMWQSVYHQMILPTVRSSCHKNVIMDRMPAKGIFVPESIYLPLTFDLPAGRESEGEMRAISGLRILRRPKPRKPKNMLRIRREKMNKHRLRKFRKKYAALIARTRMKREIQKEKLFRAELLAQIREAEQFNAEAYVRKTLATIAKTPKRETLWERRERHTELMRKYRTNVNYVRPKFDDPVK